MDRSALPGIVFWLLFLPLAALEFTKADWYVDWTRADWINFGVAFGTVGLASITAWNVIVTRSVIGAEDRRHRQSLAPIVDAWVPAKEQFRNPTVHLANIGPGPALDLEIDIVVGVAKGNETLETTLRARRAVLSANQRADEHATIELDELPNAPHIIDLVVSVHIRYRDMFGNRYQSHLSGDGTLTWTPPPRLL